MQKAALAHELRQRQQAFGRVPATIIAAVSDDAIIDSYITCSCCGEKQVTPEDLETALFLARDAESFFNLCDQRGRHSHVESPSLGSSMTTREAFLQKLHEHLTAYFAERP